MYRQKPPGMEFVLLEKGSKLLCVFITGVSVFVCQMLLVKVPLYRKWGIVWEMIKELLSAHRRGEQRPRNVKSQRSGIWGRCSDSSVKPIIWGWLCFHSLVGSVHLWCLHLCSWNLTNKSPPVFPCSPQLCDSPVQTLLWMSRNRGFLGSLWELHGT